MNTFTAQELAELYKKAAEGGKLEFRYPTRTEWKTTNCGPTPLSSPNDWRVKPTKKIVDLSMLIDSQIDCEFSDGCFDNYKDVSVLTYIKTHDIVHPYTSGDMNLSYNKCRPRMNHIHAWQGGDCPLPEGFMVKVWWRDSLCDTRTGLAHEMNWQDNANPHDIIAFEVLGLADGYVMPWESD